MIPPICVNLCLVAGSLFRLLAGIISPLKVLWLRDSRFNIFSAIAFVRGLLSVSPTERLTADQALEHEWFQVWQLCFSVEV